MRIGRRAAVSATAMAVASLALGLTACEPPPPTPVFTVETDGPGDADPGDGVCANAFDTCTLTAAVDEGNALGRATILLPDLSAGTGLIPTITGNLRILPQGSKRAAAVLAGGLFVVAPGGHLDLERISPAYESWAHVRVEVQGTAQIKDSNLQELVVARGGGAVAIRSVIRSSPDWRQTTQITNDGDLALLYSFTIAPITTGSEASTHVAASIIKSTCSGTLPTSGGYNAGYTDACGLREPTDLPASTPLDYSTLEGVWSYYLIGGGNLLDRVPVGAVGCGIAGSTPPPLMVAEDSNRDGTPGCEIGARQIGDLPEGWEG